MSQDTSASIDPELNFERRREQLERELQELVESFAREEIRRDHLALREVALLALDGPWRSSERLRTVIAEAREGHTLVEIRARIAMEAIAKLMPLWQAKRNGTQGDLEECDDAIAFAGRMHKAFTGAIDTWEEWLDEWGPRWDAEASRDVLTGHRRPEIHVGDVSHVGLQRCAPVLLECHRALIGQMCELERRAVPDNLGPEMLSALKVARDATVAKLPAIQRAAAEVEVVALHSANRDRPDCCTPLDAQEYSGEALSSALRSLEMQIRSTESSVGAWAQAHQQLVSPSFDDDIPF